MVFSRSLPGALIALACHSIVRADDAVPVASVLVEGTRSARADAVDAASAGSVDARTLALRAVYRPGELLESVPGLIVSQHSGEGKANQFYLRGFNLDHGTDLATSVDGMPVNQRSHAHGQGWTDLNFVFPELVERLDYGKGPYDAAHGDFASAGSASVVYAERLPDNLAILTAGQHGYRRAALAASTDLAQGSLLYALEAVRNDGPYTQGDAYRKFNGVLRYGRGDAANGWNVTAMLYRARWNATDQIPERAVEDGSLGRFDAVDPTDGGAAERASLSASWRSSDAAGSSRASAYVIRNRLDLFSNFTYFLDDPVNGDQFAQPDRRVTSGFDAAHTWRVRGAGVLATDWTLGLQAQNDNIFNGLYHTRARQVLSTTRADHVVETSAAVYLSNATRWTPTFRTVAGVRADAYRFDVDSSLAANSGRSAASMASPSLNLIFGPWSSTELYANIGEGFHSNDARGTLTTVDPKTGEDTAAVPGLVRSRGVELGLRTEAIPRMRSTLSLYRLDFASELVFVGDAGTTEAGRPSRRYGVEFSNDYRILDWLSLDVDAAYARARYRDADPAGSRIPGAIEGTGQVALSVEKRGPWSGALRLRYFGPRPLIEDDSVRSHASLTLNGRIGYRIDARTRIEVEGFNLTNRRDSAIDYYYASRLAAESTAVEDIHFHPIEARSFRVSLSRSW